MMSPGQPGAFWRDRPTLVTGGTGLLGGHLVRHLVEQGTNVVVLVRDWVPHAELVKSYGSITLAQGDVRDQGILERILGEYEIATVFHLAAQTIVGVANRNPTSTFSTNIGGTWALLNAVRACPTVQQVVVASSDKAYGTSPQLPYDESMPLQGRHPYDVSKSCADLLAQSYATTFGTPVVVTRCGNFFGGGDLNWSRIVPGTIRSVLRGEPPMIRSDGTSIRDYLYVEDGALAYMHLAEAFAERPALLGECFNFSNEVQMTVLGMVQQILTLMNSNLSPQIHSQANHEIAHQHLSAHKARTMLQWQPRYSMEEGLTKTINWYRQFFTARND